jgi:hypothetical protein
MAEADPIHEMAAEADAVLREIAEEAERIFSEAFATQIAEMAEFWRAMAKEDAEIAELWEKTDSEKNAGRTRRDGKQVGKEKAKASEHLHGKA